MNIFDILIFARRSKLSDLLQFMIYVKISVTRVELNWNRNRSRLTEHVNVHEVKKKMKYCSCN